MNDIQSVGQLIDILMKMKQDAVSLFNLMASDRISLIQCLLYNINYSFD